MEPIKNSEILFIINPHSGSRRYKTLIRKIRKIDQGLTYVITRHNETVRQLFDQNLDKYRAFVVVGGDGTVRDSARYLYNREDKVMAVVPNGSGNGFAYELGFTRNIDSLLDDIRRGETMKLDVLELNGIECINIAGLGFDSYVAHRFSKGRTRGFFTYLVITIRALFAYRPFQATLMIGGRTITGRYQMACFANNKQFGNYAYIAPFAKPNDGLLDIVLIKPLPFYLYPDFVIRMFLGRLKESKYISFYQTGDPVQVNASMHEFHIDGDPVVFDEPVTLRIADKFLNVVRTGRNRL